MPPLLAMPALKPLLSWQPNAGSTWGDARGGLAHIAAVEEEPHKGMSKLGCSTGDSFSQMGM